MRFDPRPLPKEWIAETSKTEVWLSLLVPLGVLLLCCFLPTNTYILFQELDGHASRATQVYERLLSPSKPLDVVFLGTSHTMVSVNPKQIEQDLATQGITTSVGNISIPWHGRDMQYAMLKHLLSRHHPKLVLIEVRNIESRLSHKLFPYIADPFDLFSAPLLLNPSYFKNLAGLPGRNVRALGKSIHPEAFGMKAEPSYGEEYDFYQFEPHDESFSKEEMEEKKNEHLRAKRWRYLPEKLDWLEFRFPRHYRKEMIDLLEASGAKIAFLYLPFYGAPEHINDMDDLTKHGQVLMPPQAMLEDYSLWFDATHLNIHGAKKLSAWLGESLPDLLKQL